MRRACRIVSGFCAYASYSLAGSHVAGSGPASFQPRFRPWAFFMQPLLDRHSGHASQRFWRLCEESRNLPFMGQAVEAKWCLYRSAFTSASKRAILACAALIRAASRPLTVPSLPGGMWMGDQSTEGAALCSLRWRAAAILSASPVRSNSLSHSSSASFSFRAFTRERAAALESAEPSGKAPGLSVEFVAPSRPVEPLDANN